MSPMDIEERIVFSLLKDNGLIIHVQRDIIGCVRGAQCKPLNEMHVYSNIQFNSQTEGFRISVVILL